MKKLFDLPPRSIEIIHEFMKEKGFKTEVDTVIYLIEQSKNEKLLVDKIKDNKVTETETYNIPDDEEIKEFIPKRFIDDDIDDFSDI